MMNTAFRDNWLKKCGHLTTQEFCAKHGFGTVAEAVNRALEAEAKVANFERKTNLVELTRVQYDALREAALKGMEVYSATPGITARRFKTLREAWNRLAPTEGKRRFVIEVKT